MPDVEIVPLAVSLSVCVFLAVLGNLWVGDALKTWYPNLVKPPFLVPLWAFIVVGVAVYLVEGVVLYRLLVHVASPEGKVVAVTALVVLMVSNEAWNYAFFGLRSTLAALVGIVGLAHGESVGQHRIWRGLDELVHRRRQSLQLWPHPKATRFQPDRN